MAFPDKGISTLIHVDCITLFSQKKQTHVWADFSAS